MITNESILTSPRHAGNVARYHTWPTLQKQTLGDHTFHVIRIYDQLFGPIPPHVTTYLIWHDLGELSLGDLPYPSKAQNPDLKEAADKLEAKGRAALGAPEVEISAEEKKRAKLADLIEMFEFGMVELQFGNTWAHPVVSNMTEAISSLCAAVSDVDRAKVLEYVSKVAVQFAGNDVRNQRD